VIGLGAGFTGLGSPPAHLPSDGLATTAWVCLIPLAICALLVFRLPMRARQP